ncbi:glutaminyl-peptide cyclotransferase [Actinosynnema sp. CA-248983]
MTSVAARTVSAGVAGMIAADGLVVRGSVFVDGRLVEAVDTDQGSAVRVVSAGDGRVRLQVGLPAGMRAGGLARVPAGVWQLPLDGGVAVLRDAVTLQEKRRVVFDGAGSGLCFTGAVLVHSEGGNRLVLRDPDDLAERSSVRVTGHWVAAQRLAGLACVHADGRPQVWALVMGSDWAARIDPASGVVTAVAGLARIRAEEPGITGMVGAIAAAGEPDLFWVSGPFRHRFLVRLKVAP